MRVRRSLVEGGGQPVPGGYVRAVIKEGAAEVLRRRGRPVYGADIDVRFAGPQEEDEYRRRVDEIDQARAELEEIKAARERSGAELSAITARLGKFTDAGEEPPAELREEWERVFADPAGSNDVVHAAEVRITDLMHDFQRFTDRGGSEWSLRLEDHPRFVEQRTGSSLEFAVLRCMLTWEIRIARQNEVLMNGLRDAACALDALAARRPVSREPSREELAATGTAWAALREGGMGDSDYERYLDDL